MIRWYVSVWSYVNDAQLQSLYYSACAPQANAIWLELKRHPDHVPTKTFHECVIEEMAYRWMILQRDWCFTPATQDVDAYV